MTRLGGLGAGLRAEFESDPLLTLAVAAALFALATTPIAFALLGRTEWLETRRGRSYQKPAFWSVVCSMLLVMGIPAIFALIALKSRHFDESRYEFDPNQTISVLGQGRQYASLKDANEALQAEQARLEAKENELLNAVKRLDESMLALRSAAQQHPETYRSLPKVMDTLADVHKAVGLDAPQQLINLTAPPAALAAATSGAPPYIPPPGAAVLVAAPAAAAGGTTAAPAAPSGNGLSKAEFEAEIATVPPPQQRIARFLPLDDVPAGWVAPKSGDKHLETFNAENLFEKIDGRAESFIQYDVVGMAYTYFHPVGDEASEAQVYIFEMANALKAFGKYGSEKPDEVTAVPIGADGYTSAGSVFFHQDRYYVQIVTTTDDPKVSAFALEIAKKIAARMKPGGTQVAEGTPEPAAAGPKVATPELLFEILPAGPGRAGEKYVAQDVFGYSFFTDVFLADYNEGDATWQGFVRPYASPAEAKGILEKYLSEVKEFGAEVKELTVEGADGAVQSTLDGLTDVILLKGNTIAGANGCTDAAKAEAFARAFAKGLPAEVPALPASPPKPAGGGGGGEAGGEGY